jgi:hypothetical protein
LPSERLCSATKRSPAERGLKSDPQHHLDAARLLEQH